VALELYYVPLRDSLKNFFFGDVGYEDIVIF
jgi:hypothetical protein